jgi:hypothetical protein
MARKKIKNQNLKKENKVLLFVFGLIVISFLLFALSYYVKQRVTIDVQRFPVYYEFSNKPDFDLITSVLAMGSLISRGLLIINIKL